MVDPVQSIRVAVVLAERFGTIISQGNAAFGEKAVSELELRIGEAQQMYPEIWRHLDDACGALTARGTDVSAYDAVRRADLVELGVTDVEASDGVDLVALRHGRLQNKQAKAAAFNVEGYRRAVAACQALMAAMPEVDWNAQERAEAVEIARAGSLRGNHRIWWLLGAGAVALGGVAAILSLGRPGETAAEKEERERAEAERALDQQIRKEIAADEAKHANDRPSCDESFSYLEHQLVEKYGLVHDEDWVSKCAGGRFRIDGEVRPALAFTVTARQNGELITLRGFADPDTFKPIHIERFRKQIDDIEVHAGSGADEVIWKSGK